MLIQERLDKITLDELTRLAEEKEKRARKSKKPDEAERWYQTAEWLRDLRAIGT